MGTVAGWSFFVAVVSLFGWGFWMGLMGIMAPLPDEEVTTERPNGSSAMVYYNAEEGGADRRQAA